ncbi:uncharacterized protein METZ01_LOCUS278356, partial [marine metagenome]
MLELMKLDDLMEGIAYKVVQGTLDRTIVGLATDSRQVQPGDLFVAIRGGQEQDRHAFVPEAVAKGAAAVVVEENVEKTESATQIQVDNCRQTLGVLAAKIHGFPARQLRCLGVTGTNGKTTTARLLQKVMQAGGEDCAYLGTLGFEAGADALRPLANTTPEAHELQVLLTEVVSAGCASVAMEVSSHALSLGRTAQIPFELAVFTNLTRDHLDFHGSEKAYLAAKAQLFAELDETSHAVINLDDDGAKAIADATRAQVMSYGIESADATIR